MMSDSSVPIHQGKNQFVARKDVWKYLVQLFSYVVSFTLVPKQSIFPLIPEVFWGKPTSPPFEIKLVGNYYKKIDEK